MTKLRRRTAVPPSVNEVTWSFLHEQARRFARTVGPLNEEVLRDQMVALLGRHERLRVRLPWTLGPELERLQAAMVDEAEMAGAVDGAVAVIDRPVVRAGLLLEATELWKEGELSPELLAIIAADLACPTSAFVRVSVIASVALTLDRCATGVLVSAAG